MGYRLDNMSRFLLALALLAGADAYMLAPLRVRPSTMRAAVTVMGVEEAVADCLESGCSIDDVSTLIGELKTKSSSQKDGSLDKASTLGMIVQLTELNKEPEANKNALERLISGFGRSFGTVERSTSRARRSATRRSPARLPL